MYLVFINLRFNEILEKNKFFDFLVRILASLRRESLSDEENKDPVYRGTFIILIDNLGVRSGYYFILKLIGYFIILTLPVLGKEVEDKVQTLLGAAACPDFLDRERLEIEALLVIVNLRLKKKFSHEDVFEFIIKDADKIISEKFDEKQKQDLNILTLPARGV